LEHKRGTPMYCSVRLPGATANGRLCGVACRTKAQMFGHLRGHMFEDCNGIDCEYCKVEVHEGLHTRHEERCTESRPEYRKLYPAQCTYQMCYLRFARHNELSRHIVRFHDAYGLTTYYFCPYVFFRLRFSFKLTTRFNLENAQDSVGQRLARAKPTSTPPTITSGSASGAPSCMLVNPKWTPTCAVQWKRAVACTVGSLTPPPTPTGNQGSASSRGG
jgi:hypothetical protein